MQPTATPFPAPISLAADTTLGGINSAYDITLNNHTLTYTPSAGPAAVFTGNFIGPGRIVHDGVGTQELQSNITGSVTITQNTGTLIAKRLVAPNTAINVTGGVLSLSKAVDLGSVNLSGNYVSLQVGIDTPELGDHAVVRGLTLSATGSLELYGRERAQLEIRGPVNLNGAELDATQAIQQPGAPASFTLIDNDGADPIQGTFKNLPEGATVAASGVLYTISYVGGTGNDVTLTYLAPTTTPTPAGGTSSPPTTTLTPTVTLTPTPTPLSGTVSLNADATWPGLSGSAAVDLNNHTLTLNPDDYSSTFSGNINGPGLVTLGAPGGQEFIATATATRLNIESGLLYLNVLNAPNTDIVVTNGALSLTQGADVGSLTSTGTLLLGEPTVSTQAAAKTKDLTLRGGLLALSNAYNAKLAVTGAVSLVNTALDISNFSTFAKKPAGYSLTVIDNDGTDPIQGTFNGLPEGGTVTDGVNYYQVSYVGGTGNDFIVTAIVPTFTPTPTPSPTFTPTTIPTPTPADPEIPSDTPTFTPTATDTPTFTPTQTPTPTITPTLTPVPPTPTFTPTSTPSNTPTTPFTPTNTPTLTATATRTPTNTPTFTPTLAPGKARIQGTVRNGSSGLPLSGVRVYVVLTTPTPTSGPTPTTGFPYPFAYTNATGNYSLTFDAQSPGTYTLFTSLIGYNTVAIQKLSISPGADLTYNMQPVPLGSPSVTPTATFTSTPTFTPTPTATPTLPANSANVSGTFVDENNSPISGARIYVVLKAPAPTAGPTPTTGFQYPFAYTNTNGVYNLTFSLPSSGTGTYDLMTSSNLHKTVKIANLTLTSGSRLVYQLQTTRLPTPTPPLP